MASRLPCEARHLDGFMCSLALPIRDDLALPLSERGPRLQAATSHDHPMGLGRCDLLVRAAYTKTLLVLLRGEADVRVISEDGALAWPR